MKIAFPPFFSCHVGCFSLSSKPLITSHPPILLLPSRRLLRVQRARLGKCWQELLCLDLIKTCDQVCHEKDIYFYFEVILAVVLFEINIEVLSG